MMIRHAQSEQNAYMETISARMVAGELSVGDFNKAMRHGPPGTAAGDDAKLTELGLTQAQRLADTWAPLLVEKARQGKLRCLVSPFQRTLQTADPLMQQLRKHSPTLEAVLLPAIMESGGLTDAEDFAKFDEIEVLMNEGKRKEAIALLKGIEWKPQGMNAKQVRAGREGGREGQRGRDRHER